MGNGTIYIDGVPEEFSGNLAEYKDRNVHCIGGPAIIVGKAEIWMKNGKFHREDGPAMISFVGTFDWHLNDRQITDEVEQWIEENNLPPYTDWDEDTKLLFKLTWC